MANEVEAVLAALRSLSETVEASDEDYWPVATVNRWLDQLPGDRAKWESLELEGDEEGVASYGEFLAHIRSLIAFLENYKF